MPSAWEREERRQWTRREWLKVGLLAGVAGAAGLGAGIGISFLLAPPPPSANILERLVYTKFPTAQWWNSSSGRPMRVTEFGLWQGATGVWRGTFTNGILVAGTGFPILVVRVPRDDRYFASPSGVSLPTGLSLYNKDPSQEKRIVALIDR